jgi:hypothetical protein
MEDGDVMRAMMMAAAAGAGEDRFPVKTKQWVQVVNGHSTDFVVCLFANCVFVIVTQLGKIGTMVSAPDLILILFYFLKLLLSYLHPPDPN